MTIAEHSGVRLLDGRDGVQFVMPDGAGYQPCVDFIRSSQNSKLVLWLRAEDGGDAIALFLRCVGVDHVQRLHIQTKGLDGFEGLSSLRHLQAIGIDSDIAFDFSQMPQLESVGGVWSEKWTNLDKCGVLKRLRVSAFNRKSLEDVPCAETLEELSLIQTRLQSLKGIEAAGNLQELCISYGPSLLDISGLAFLGRLRKLEIESCKKVKNFEEIGRVAGLETLLLKQCGTLPSISFIAHNTHLIGLGLIDTKLADLDLSYCLKHPTLRRFGATGLRGTKPSVAEVEKTLAARN
jgi:Leucine-rich repeat (LRR) protein